VDSSVDPSELEALQRALPERMRAAAHALAAAERRLGRILALRASGVAVKRSEISGARMGHARALRDAEDLRWIQAVLPELVERPKGRSAGSSVRLIPV